MAGTSGYQDDDGGASSIADINVTPLVDITLVLLIIFMVTASYIVNPSIHLDLPRAASGDATAKSTLAVALRCEDPDHPGTLLQANQLLVDGRASTEAELKEAVTHAVTANPDVTCIIGADRRCEHGQVIHLLDLSKQAGARHIAENVDDGNEGAAGP